jgi:hypothetical protein
MVAKTLLLTLTLLLSSASFSAGYIVKQPGTGVTWKKSEAVDIVWLGTIEANVDVKLVKGPAANLQFVTTLCANVPSNKGKCSYTVDEDLISGRDYAVTVGKSVANLAYSSFFTIEAKGALPAPKGCPNFGGQDCPESLPCCSASGFCGNSPAHCGLGCDPKHSFNGKCANPGPGPTPPTPPTPLPKPPTPSNQEACGTVMCSSNAPCCSKYGYCGSTPDHCGNGCQAGKSFNGKCLAAPSTPTPNPPITPPKQLACGKSMCTSAAPCCSKYGYCGSTPAHCGGGCQAGKSFNGKCLASAAPIKRSKCGSKYCTKTSPCCGRNNKCAASVTACKSGCQAKKSFAGKCLV